MKVTYKTGREKLALSITILTRHPQKMRIQVYDSIRPNSFYTDREGTVSGKRVFIVKMPVSPDQAIIRIFNTKHGDLPKGQDPTYKVEKIERVPLKTYGCINLNDPAIKDWIEFSREWADKAGWLSAGPHTDVSHGGSTYISNDGRYRIDYFDELIDWERNITNRQGIIIPNPNYGKPLATPFRIGSKTGIIQASKKKVMKYTIPQRWVLLDHEFSHGNVNENPSDEFEADKNGIKLSLSTGTPKIEVQNGWLEVFRGTPSDLNVRRHKALSNYIENFEKLCK